MNFSVKNLIIGLIILAVIGILIYFAITGNGPGTLIAGLATLFGGYKSKIFDGKSLEESLDDVETHHTEKRAGWEQIRQEYASKYAALEARMDYIDFKTAKLTEQIDNLDEVQKEKIKKINESTPEEMLNEFRRLMNQ